MIDMAIFETDKVDEIEELDYLEDHIINMDMLFTEGTNDFSPDADIMQR